jgi:acetoin utilization protein AcuB
MIANQLIQNSYPLVGITDKVGFVLQLMDDYDVLHLPVISEEKFVGLIAKTDLLDADEQSPVASLQEVFIQASVLTDTFFLAALQTITEHEVSLLPVLSPQHEVVGTISSQQLLRTASQFLGNDERGGIIVLEVDRRHFSFGEISRLVETNDAYITQLNTQVNQQTGLTTVTIKVNRMEISDIIATFQRYDYTINHYFGEEQYANTLKENYHHLMAYLNI